jgi:Uma2 family endonuclease
MATAPTKLMTADEFGDFVHRPGNRDKSFDLVRGEVAEMTKPGRLHGFVCANIARILGNYAVQRKKAYVCSNDTGVIVERDPDSVRGPDLLFYEDAETVDHINRKWDDKPSLLAVEVLSPNDTMSDMIVPGFVCKVAEFFRLPGQ